MSGRGHVVQYTRRIQVVTPKGSHRTTTGVYVRDRCPRCGNQSRCKRLSELRAWCGTCQAGFAR